METAKETVVSGDKPRRVIKRYSNRKLYDTKDSRYVTLHQIGAMVRAGEDVQIIDNATKEDKTEVTLALIISEDVKSQPRSVPLGTLRDVIQERGSRLLTQLRESPFGRILPGTPTSEDEEEGADAVTPAPDAEAAPATTASAAPPTAPPVTQAAAPPAAQPPAAQPAAAQPPAQPAGPGEAQGEKPKGRFTEMLVSSRQTIDQWQQQWQHALDDRMRTILPGMSALQAGIKTLTQRVEALEARLSAVEGARGGGATQAEASPKEVAQAEASPKEATQTQGEAARTQGEAAQAEAASGEATQGEGAQGNEGAKE